MITEKDLSRAREGMKRTLRHLFVSMIYPDAHIYDYNYGVRSVACGSCKWCVKVVLKNGGYYGSRWSFYGTPNNKIKKCSVCPRREQNEKEIKYLQIQDHVKDSVQKAMELPEIKELIQLKAAINKLKNKIIEHEATKHKINVFSTLHLHGETGQQRN